jgi:expansin (peptidoglycan-binding protein)
MPKNKIQKVRFHKGDQRPGPVTGNLTYRKRMIKSGSDIKWQVVEYPRKVVVSTFFFEEDATELVKFQNKHKVWKENGGIPMFLCSNNYK